MEAIKKILNTVFISVSLFTPFLVCHAQGTFTSIFRRGVSALLNAVLPFLLTLGVAYFIIGVIKFISAGGDAEKIKKAKNNIVWGLVGLFFMIAFWAVVWMVLYTFFDGAPGMPAGWPPVPF